MNAPKAFIFDVFGTLVDWRTSVATILQSHFEDMKIDANPMDFAVAWRAAYDPAMEPIRAGRRTYTNLDILHRENLEATLSGFGLDGRFSQVQIATLARAWERLRPWPDTIMGLAALRELGPIAPCSNGSIAMMTNLARFAGIQWDCILGAEIAKNYKPHPDTYLVSCAALQLEPSDVIMIAAHNSDLEAAKDAGLMTGFLPRPTEHADSNKNEPRATGDWDVIGTDLVDVARICAGLHGVT